MPQFSDSSDLFNDVETTLDQKRAAAIFAARHVPQERLIEVLGMLGVIEALRPTPEPVFEVSVPTPEPVIEEEHSNPAPRFGWAVPPSWARKFPWANRRGDV